MENKNLKILFAKSFLWLFAAHSIPGNITCSFDYELCGWVQRKDDTFDWSLVQSGTLPHDAGKSLFTL